MRLKTKIKLITLLGACTAVSLFAGCKIGEMTKDEYLNKNGVTDQCVTYYANGGTFKESSDEYVEVYFKEDAYIIATADLSRFSFERTNYVFDGWYYVQTDSAGNVIFDSEGNAVLGTQKVQATDKISAGEHLYVGAKWNMNVMIETYLVYDGTELTTSDNSYKSGDLIRTSSNFGGLAQSQHAVSATNATYIGFFEDEECTKPITNISRPADASGDNIKIYVKYIEGSWTVVSNSTSVRTMLNGYNGGGKYYLYTPDGSNVINYTSAAVSLKDGDCNITIAGNGVTITGVTFNSSNLSGGEYAMFGHITNDADISDLILKDVVVEASVRSGSVELYLAFNGCDDSAKISGLVIENVTYTINSASGANILNIQLLGGTTDENWLFGGYDTDDEFINEKGGLAVINAKLTLNGSVVAENITKQQEEQTHEKNN